MLAFLVLVIFAGICHAVLKADMSLGLYALFMTCLGLVLAAISVSQLWQFTGFGAVAFISVVVFALRKYGKRDASPVHKYSDWSGRGANIERPPFGDRRPLF